MKRIVLKGRDALIKTAKSIKHSVTHPKETAAKAVKYVKENPDEAIVVGTAEVVPAVMTAKAVREGDKEKAAMWGALNVVPIGAGYVAGKKGVKALLRKSKAMSDQSEKEDLRSTSLKGLDLKDRYKAKAAYIPVTIGTYIGGRMLAKKLGAGKVARNYAPLIPAIAAGRLTKKAVVGRLKNKAEQKEYSRIRKVHKIYQFPNQGHGLNSKVPILPEPGTDASGLITEGKLSKLFKRQSITARNLLKYDPRTSSNALSEFELGKNLENIRLNLDNLVNTSERFGKDTHKMYKSWRSNIVKEIKSNKFRNKYLRKANNLSKPIPIVGNNHYRQMTIPGFSKHKIKELNSYKYV